MTQSFFLTVAVCLASFTYLACGGVEITDEDLPSEASILGVEVREDSEVEKYDLSGDGKADVWKYFTRAGEAKIRVKARTDRDYNWDGTIDSSQHFDMGGVMVREELDLDFDGAFDAVDYYSEGKLYKREMAFTFAEQPTIWKFYDQGEMIRKERDTSGDGKPDTLEYWEKGRIVRVGFDRDGDGNPDFYEDAPGE